MDYPRAELVVDRCLEWLHEAPRFEGDAPPHVSMLDTRLKALVNGELRDRWRIFQLFRGAREFKQADQLALQLAAATREGVILDHMRSGASYVIAKSMAHDQLQAARPAFCAQLERHTEHLDASFGVAVGTVEQDSQQLRAGYVHTVGLAVAHLVQRADRQPGVRLPAPCYPDDGGEIVLWGRPLSPPKP